MNTRKHNIYPALLMERCKAIMPSSDESRYLFRVFVYNMILSETPVSQVGASTGFTKAVVTGWVETVN